MILAAPAAGGTGAPAGATTILAWPLACHELARALKDGLSRQAVQPEPGG